MHRSHWEFIILANYSLKIWKEERFVPITDRNKDSEAYIFAVWASQLQIQDSRQPENMKYELLT